MALFLRLPQTRHAPRGEVFGAPPVRLGRASPRTPRTGLRSLEPVVCHGDARTCMHGAATIAPGGPIRRARGAALRRAVSGVDGPGGGAIVALGRPDIHNLQEPSVKLRHRRIWDSKRPAPRLDPGAVVAPLFHEDVRLIEHCPQLLGVQ